MRELIDDIEHAILSPLMGAVFDEVIGPDMVAPFWQKADAGSVVEPSTAAFWLLLRNLQSLLPPDPFDPFVVHDPASRRSQHRCDLPEAISAVLPGELDNVGDQLRFVILAPWPLALRRAMLSEHTADPPLGQLQLRSNVIDAGAATRGA